MPTRREASLEKKATLEDFEFIGLMGEGSYGRVFLGKKKKTGKFYAIKCLDKRKLLRDKKQHEVFRER